MPNCRGDARGGCRRARSVSTRTAAFSLVELLVATAITSMILAATWGWVWNAAAAAQAVGERAQAGTSAAAAVRAVAGDIRLASVVQAPPSPLSAARALHLQHRHAGEPAESIIIAWDPDRRVLWRKAPGTYLADHVAAFAVTYLDARGEALALAEAPGDALWWRCVARVEVSVTVSSGRSTVTARHSVALPGA